jgi:hypothetical protein
MMLAKAIRLRRSTFIVQVVQASFTIVTYDRKNIFIIQATGVEKNEQHLNEYFYIF